MNTTLAQWSNLFVYGAMGIYTLAMISFAVSFAAARAPKPSAAKAATPELAGVVTWGGASAASASESTSEAAQRPAEPLAPGRRSANIAIALTWAGFLMLLVGVVLRAVWAQRVPWGNMYEFSLTSALALSGVYLVANAKRDLRWLGVFVLPVILLTLGLAVTVLYNDSAQLVPALKSYWLVIHVSAAVICAGGFSLGAAVTALYLIRDRAERKAGTPELASGFSSRLPSAASLDALSYRIHAFTFPLWTFAIVAGAVWAEDAWGRYWGWDPKETWAFITWVVYAGYLHARSTAGWRGRRAAAIALIGFAAFVFNYFIVNIIFSGLHSYAGVS